VWATDWNNGTLYGLNPQTGRAVVNQTNPAMEHFATPAASDGNLFLATGHTVEAYTIANPATASVPQPPRRRPHACSSWGATGSRCITRSPASITSSRRRRSGP